MIHQSQEHYEPKELIEYIKGLRNSNEDVEILLEKFLKYSAHLIKAPIAILLSQKREQEWNLLSSYGFKGFKKEESETVELALQMSGRVITKGFSYERVSLWWLHLPNQIAFAIKIDKDIDGNSSFLYFIMEYKTQQHLSEMIIRTLMNSDIPTLLFTTKERELSNASGGHMLEDRVSPSLSIDVLEILSKIIFQEKFLLASMFLVNEIAIRFNCSQVSFGWEKGHYINPIAISHIEKFDKNMESIRALEALYEESADQDEEIIYPVHELNDTIVFAHHHYVDTMKAKEVFSIPFRNNDRVIGVLSCEKIEGKFSEEELILLRLVSNYITPWLSELHAKDRWFGSRMLLKSRNSLSRFLALRILF